MPGTGGDHSRQREQHAQKLRGKEEREHGHIRSARTSNGWSTGEGSVGTGARGAAEAAMEVLVGRG